GPVEVEQEGKGGAAAVVAPARLLPHPRPEVETADTDIDDVANAFSGMALPLAAADAVGEFGHLVEHGMNVGHHVLSVDDNRRPSWRTQRNVQDRAIFRDVDFLASEHRVDSFARPGLL